MARNNNLINIETTNKKLTSFAGLLPFANAINNSYFIERLEKVFYYKEKKRNRGFSHTEKLISLVQLIISGGEHLSDIEQIDREQGYKSILGIDKFPKANTLSEYLNQADDTDTNGMYLFNIDEVIRYYKRNNIKSVVWDIDSSLIENAKQSANWTYEKFKGYNPMFILDDKYKKVVAGIFRNGNASPQSDIIKILKHVIALMESDIDISIRIDSAGYQKEIVDFLNEQKIAFTITGDSSSSKTSLFYDIPEDHWEKYDDINEVAETKDFINSKDKFSPVKIIVKRKEREQLDLFDGKYIYYYIITNITLEDKHTIAFFHQKRASAENIFKELKNDFCLEKFPCTNLSSNGFFMQILICSYNLFQMLKEKLFEENWFKYTAKTIRYKIIRLAGYVIKRSRKLILKINIDYLYLKEFTTALDTSQYALL